MMALSVPAHLCVPPSAVSLLHHVVILISLLVCLSHLPPFLPSLPVTSLLVSVVYFIYSLVHRSLVYSIDLPHCMCVCVRVITVSRATPDKSINPLSVFVSVLAFINFSFIGRIIFLCGVWVSSSVKPSHTVIFQKQDYKVLHSNKKMRKALEQINTTNQRQQVL